MSIGITKEEAGVRANLLRSRLSKEGADRMRRHQQLLVARFTELEALKGRFLPYSRLLAESAAESYIAGGHGRFRVELPIRGYDVQLSTQKSFYVDILRVQIKQMLPRRGSRFSIWLTENVEDEGDVFAYIEIHKLGRIK
jgi:hypothetical protein